MEHGNFMENAAVILQYGAIAFSAVVFAVRLVWKKHENKLQRAARQAAAREKFEIFRY
jgi:hypothetical protein